MWNINDGEFIRYEPWFSPGSGVYSVNLTVSDGYQMDSITKEILVPQSLSYDTTSGQANISPGWNGNITNSITINISESTTVEVSKFLENPTNGTLYGNVSFVSNCFGIEIEYRISR